MGLDAIFKFGYAMLVGTIALMIYASLASAQISTEVEDTYTTFPACQFNPLCTCSKGVTDLGHMVCKDVPLSRMPRQINSSRVHILEMENNGLRHIEPYFLEGTGIYRIAISKNNLTDITPEAFTGLERTLAQLVLNSNHLVSVPSRAIRYLQKLQLLNLTDNDISDVAPESWRGIEETLTDLILRNNDITSLRADVFSALRNLEVLDLSGNALLELSENTFHDGPPKLSKLFLQDNSIHAFPYEQLSALTRLQHLDLSHNRISQLHSWDDDGQGTRASLSLDTLHLDYNMIQYLPSRAFENFKIINTTFLNGNPISIIQVDAFVGPKMTNLHLKDCGISELAPGAFAGLEVTLTHLDLTGNNLTQLPQRLFQEFEFLEMLSLRDNLIIGFNPLETFTGPKYQLNHLDMSGSENSMLAIQDLKRMTSLRTLVLSRLPQDSLKPEDFNDLGMDLRNLKITNGNLKGVKNHAFKNIQTLERLDLSENVITQIENDAFSEVGNSLVYLNLASALAPSVSKLPNEAFRQLTALRRLDISNNKIKTLPETSFHFMKTLQLLHMEDNQIEAIPKGTFQGDIHSHLEKIFLSFNQLSSIVTDTFVGLRRLDTLRLTDNRLSRVEKSAFMNLNKLKYLSLRGNKLNSLAQEAFQNLPALQQLDLAYNEMKNLDFSCLDQVGTLSSLRLNVSHNEIKHLDSNASVYVTDNMRGSVVQINIQELDFSYNNLSSVGRWYFRPVEFSLTHLYMSHNSLTNVSKDLLGKIRHLQWLDISHNIIEEVDYDSFRSYIAGTLQVLQFGHNRISRLPTDLFRTMANLRVVDFSYNRLRQLPDLLFFNKGIENLYLAGNMLPTVPISSFSAESAYSLVELDLSNNNIGTLNSPDQFSRFHSLQRLDLSRNRIVRIEDGTFSMLPLLFVLNLSDNSDLTLDTKGMTFQGIDDSIEELHLRNLSMSLMPEMHLPTLRLLDLSDNHMSIIPGDLAQNLSSLRVFRVAGNKLDAAPPSLQQITQLRTLELARNPIRNLVLPLGLRLQELDIRHLPLETIEPGTLGKMPSLRTLRISPCPLIKEMNLPHLLQENYCLEHLHLEDEGGQQSIGALDNQFLGELPPKITTLEISGMGMRNLGITLLEGIRQPTLTLKVYNTSIEKIPKTIFQQAKNIRNLRLDVRFNSLKSLGNPNTGLQPGLPRKTFLADLKLEGNPWNCDCELGWVEGWERKRRQYFCTEIYDACLTNEDDLRVAVCDNKKKSVIEVLKTDVECGWNSGSSLFSVGATIIVAFLLTRSV